MADHSYRPVNDRPADAVDKSFVPTACPTCRSTDLRTTSKTICEATYWRCGGCGEIWNAGRRKEPPRRSVWR